MTRVSVGVQAELDYIEETFTPLVLKCKEVAAAALCAALQRVPMSLLRCLERHLDT